MERKQTEISPLKFLVPLLLALLLPIALVITAEISVLLAVATGLIVGAILVVAIVLIFQWPRSPHPSLSRFFVMAIFGWAFILMIIGTSFARYTAPQYCSLVNQLTSSQHVVCVTRGSARVEHDVGKGFLAVAMVLVFVSLIAVPSSERELLRRIDLEACSIAIGMCFFFFIAYSSFHDAFSLPSFTPGVAVWTVLVSYLIARLALTIRYR